MVDFSDSTTQLTCGASLLAITAAYFLVQPTPFVKWLQKKNYQYEVTFALYMLTPTEKFIFNSVLFLTLSMALIATIVYLPGHVKFLTLRAYYYMSGENGSPLVTSSRQAADKLYGSATAVRDAATEWYHAAINASTTTAAAAQEAASQVAENVEAVLQEA